MGHIFKKSNKIGKKYNVSVSNKYTSLLNTIYKKKISLKRLTW